MGANAQLDQLLSKTSTARQQLTIGRIRSALVTHAQWSVLHTVCTSAGQSRTGRRARRATTSSRRATMCLNCHVAVCPTVVDGIPAEHIRTRPALLANQAQITGASIKPAPDDKFA